MIAMEPVVDLPPPMRPDVLSIDDEIAPLEQRMEELNRRVRQLATEELRLRIELDTADVAPQPTDFASGSDYGEARWRWDAEANDRAERIIDLMGAYADALFELRDFLQQEIAPLDETLGALREKRKNTFDARLCVANFAKLLFGQFSPVPDPVPGSEGLLYNAGKIAHAGGCIGSGPTDMRPPANTFPRGTEFYDSTLKQVVRAEDGEWRNSANRVV